MKKLSLILILVVGLCTVSCRRHVVPKPYGYYRIAIPDTAYTRFDWNGYPYSFRLSTNAYVDVREKDGEIGAYLTFDEEGALAAAKALPWSI